MALAVATVAGLVVIARRQLHAGLRDALDRGLGSGWRARLDPALAARLRRRLPYARILLLPLYRRRRDVRRLGNIRYGDAGRRNLLDVYLHRSRPANAPCCSRLPLAALRRGRRRHRRVRRLGQDQGPIWAAGDGPWRGSLVSAFLDM